MVALDSAFAPAADSRNRPAFTGPVVLAALLVAMALAAGTLLLEAQSSFAWRDAEQNVLRFALVLFVAALSVEPLSRIIRTKPMRAAAWERGSLTLAFALVSIVALACELLAPQFSGAVMTLQAFAYCMLTAAILVVMLFSAHPATKKLLGAPAWRTMQRIATAYFWLVFTVTALEHLAQPNVTDRWWGIALALLLAVVLIQFVDLLLARLRRSTSEKVA